jgi:hypothetical protein
MRKVLLIAFYFNQTNEIASKRLGGLAKYLPKFGWEPVVITPDLGNSNINNNLNNGLENTIIIETDYVDMLDNWLKKFKIKKVNRIDEVNRIDKINRIDEVNKLNRINNSKNSNKNFNNGSNLTITKKRNVSKSNHENHENNLNNYQNRKNNLNHSNKSKLFSKIVSLSGELFAYPDGMKYWYKPAIEASMEAIEKYEIDSVISSSWPITSHLIANDLKKQFNIHWVADLRDLWNGNPYVSHNFIRNYFEKRLEKKTFKNVDVLTTTTEISANILRNFHPNKKIIPVLSGFDPQDSPIKSKKSFKNIKDNESIKYSENIKGDESIKYSENLEDFGNTNNKFDSYDKLNFLYAGSLYNGKRDPSILFEALNQLIKSKQIDSSKISLDFYGDDFDLKNTAKYYNIENLVNIHGYIPNNEILKKQLNAQVLLLLSWNNRNEVMFIPGKIYEYLMTKRPILSIGYKEGSLKGLIIKTNVGWHVSTIDETKSALIEIYNDFIENNSVMYMGNGHVNDYSMINTAKNFSRILNSLRT